LVVGLIEISAEMARLRNRLPLLGAPDSSVCGQRESRFSGAPNQALAGGMHVGFLGGQGRARRVPLCGVIPRPQWCHVITAPVPVSASSTSPRKGSFVESKAQLEEPPFPSCASSSLAPRDRVNKRCMVVYWGRAFWDAMRRRDHLCLKFSVDVRRMPATVRTVAKRGRTVAIAPRRAVADHAEHEALRHVMTRSTRVGALQTITYLLCRYLASNFRDSSDSVEEQSK
jgi:hypothetical protein